MRVAVRALGLIFILSVLAVGCGSDGSDGPAPAGATGVTITRAFTFDPRELSVDRGSAVTWTNTDMIAHTVTSGEPGSPTGMFDQTVDPSKTFTFTFADAGTFDFFCNFHGSMVGQITVK